MRALLVNMTTAAALLWLARTLDLNPWFVIPVMLSPYGWHYSRQLWDNTLCIPVSALAVASYASFLWRRTSFSLASSLSCMILLLLIHLMAAALIAPMLLHMIIFYWRDLLKRWPTLIAVIFVGAIISVPYLGALRGEQDPSKIPAGAGGWWFPLLGARIISGANLSYLFTADWMSFVGARSLTPLAQAAWLISLISYPLMWLGISYAAIIAFRWMMRRHESASVREQILVLALASMAA